MLRAYFGTQHLVPVAPGFLSPDSFPMVTKQFQCQLFLRARTFKYPILRQRIRREKLDMNISVKSHGMLRLVRLDGLLVVASLSNLQFFKR